MSVLTSKLQFLTVTFGGKGVMLKYMPSPKVAELLLLLLTSHLAAAVYQSPSKASPSAVDHMSPITVCHISRQHLQNMRQPDNLPVLSAGG